MNALLEINDLCLRRDDGQTLSYPDFSLQATDRLFLLGASGRGKTTLLHALLGFVEQQSGGLRVFGQTRRKPRDFLSLRGPLGLMFQDPSDQLFGPSVRDDIAFGPLNQGYSAAQAQALTETLLQRLNIVHLADKAVQHLSGGEQRLVALAGVLAMQPKVLLLDEPSNGLDENSCTSLINCMLDTGLPMLVASHDRQLADRLATRTLIL